jgi:hypothetical protein
MPNILSFTYCLLLLFSCKTKEEVEPQVPITGKVQEIVVYTGSQENRRYTFSYDKKGLLAGLITRTPTSYTTYTVNADSTGAVRKLIIPGLKDTTYYSYNTNSKLKEIRRSKGRLETFEYNKAGYVDYYSKATKAANSTVLEEVRSNKWTADKLTSQILSKPGKAFEEETMVYTTTPNPLYALLQKEAVVISL